MNTSFFLGANSGYGFFSLYEDFPGSGNFLHIIKGGPGTGKSSFMKKIRAAAKERGLNTESILCSGDSDSLDGIYIPALHTAWIDGTAPHVREPLVFGADSCYVNLGGFCKLPLKESDIRMAQEIGSEYKALYSRAYCRLSSARQLRAQSQSSLGEAPDSEALLGLLRPLLQNLSSHTEHSTIKRRFVSALSCKGKIVLKDSIYALCKSCYVTNVAPAHISPLLETIEETARSADLDIILCPDPLDPKKLEALLLPQCSIGFFSPALGLDGGLLLAFDGGSAEMDDDQKDAAQKSKALEDTALSLLSQAKALHDELEQIYRPYMDFTALDSYTAKMIEHCFDS